MPENDQTDTVPVHVWQGDRYTSYDDLLEEAPDVYEVPVVEPHRGKLPAATANQILDGTGLDGDRVVLADDIEHHGTYAFQIPNEARPATLNVHSNDSYHDPYDWGRPIEQGLTYHEADDADPFKCEIWGRVMLWVEVPEEAGA